LKGKVGQTIEEGRRVVPLEPLSYGGKGIEIPPGLFPAVPKGFATHLLGNKMGSHFFLPF